MADLRKIKQIGGEAAVRLAQVFGVQDGATYRVNEDKSPNEVGVKHDLSVGVPSEKEYKIPRWILNVAHDGSRKILTLLYSFAREKSKNRGAARKVGTEVIHLPVEMLARHLGVHRTTIWRWLEKLEPTGLVDHATHYESVDGQVVATGTVWAVRLRPGKARLTPEDLNYPWRNMKADIARGATAWAWKNHPVPPSFEDLLAWVLGARNGPPGSHPKAGDPVDLGLIPYLREVPRKDLPALITSLAEHMAQVLRDPRSRRWYAGLLWKVVRGQLDAWALYHAVQRVLVDLQEGWARKPGALLAARLSAG